MAIGLSNDHLEEVKPIRLPLYEIIRILNDGACCEDLGLARHDRDTAVTCYLIYLITFFASVSGIGLVPAF